MAIGRVTKITFSIARATPTLHSTRAAYGRRVNATLDRTNTMPHAYICVYRHFFPSVNDIQLTRKLANNDPKLQNFIDSYEAGTNYFDWGDDPSLFSAIGTHDTPAGAGWGVCRPNVRALLNQGDLVVFFCAKRLKRGSLLCKYYFMGYGTVKEVISDRREIWSRKKYESYRRHHNILVRYKNGEAVPQETFYPFHEDWRNRARSPYIIFDSDQSKFNITNPLHVANSDGGKYETWRSNESDRVKRLEKTLFLDTGIARRLRTSDNRSAHPHINVTKQRAGFAQADVLVLRDALLKLV